MFAQFRGHNGVAGGDTSRIACAEQTAVSPLCLVPLDLLRSKHLDGKDGKVRAIRRSPRNDRLLIELCAQAIEKRRGAYICWEEPPIVPDVIILQASITFTSIVVFVTNLLPLCLPTRRRAIGCRLFRRLSFVDNLRIEFRP